MRMMKRSSRSVVFCTTNRRTSITIGRCSILLTIIQILLLPLFNSYHRYCYEDHNSSSSSSSSSNNNSIHLVVTGFSDHRRSIISNSHHRHHRHAFLSSSAAAFSSSIILADDNNDAVFSHDDEDNNDDEVVVVNLIELLGTCVKAAQLGCHEIRRIHTQMKRSSSSSDTGTDTDGRLNETNINTVDYKIMDDPRSALTAADVAAQLVIVKWIDSMYPGITLIGEEDLVCDKIDDNEVPVSDATGGSVGASTDILKNENYDVAIENLKKELYASLKNKSNSNYHTTDNNIKKIPMKDITLFVDPLDGTREFVEGRVYNVQCLIGIAVNGYAVGGAVGLPFPMIENDVNTTTTDEKSDSSSSSSSSNSSHEEEWASSSPASTTDVAIICALEGTGPPRVVQQEPTNNDVMMHRRHRADSSNPIHGGGILSDSPRPLLVSGDVRNDAVLEAAYTVALSNSENADEDNDDTGTSGGSTSIGNTGGRALVLGGTGQKCLAVAEHRADIAIMNFLSSSWDTCAPEALVRASGGYVTDIFGERIIHAKNPQLPPPPTTTTTKDDTTIAMSSAAQNKYLNRCGVIASSKEYRNTHDTICTAMQQNRDALSRCLTPWGLVLSDVDDEQESTGLLLPTREEVASILHYRREIQWKGV